MRIRKRLFSHRNVLLLALLLTILLTACSSENKAKDDRSSKPAQTATPAESQNALTDTPAPSNGDPSKTPATPTDTPTTPTATPAQPTGNPATPTEPPVPFGFSAPEKNCSIDLPTGDLYHYDMDLVLDTVNNTVGGHVVFRFYNDSDKPWDKLCLRDYPSLFSNVETLGYEGVRNAQGAMTVIENICDNRDDSMIEYTRDTDISVLWLNLTSPLAPNESMTLEYDFTTKIPSLGDRFGVYESIYNVANFYPILAEYTKDGWSRVPYYLHGECFYSEIADYDVRLTVPSDVTVASTGLETGRTDGNGAVTYTFRAPAVRDFVFSASDEFCMNSEMHDGVRVNVWYRDDYPDSDMTDVLRYSQLASGNALRAFGEAFGRYPYEELDIVISALTAGGGMEYPNLIQIGDEMFLYGHNNSIEGSAPYYDLQMTIAHEIGHQWFMGIVGSNSGLQPWQDESITSYAETVFADYVNEHGGNMKPPYIVLTPDDESPDFTDEDFVKSYRDSQMFPINLGIYDYRTDNRYLYSIYVVGQWVLESIEDAIGRENFYAVLREYVHRNAFANADPESFFEILYECAGPNNATLNAILRAAFDLPDGNPFRSSQEGGR